MKIKHLRFKNLILVAIFALMSGSAWAQSVVSFGVYYGTEPCGYWIYYSIIQDPNYTNAVEVYNGGAYNNYSGAIEVPETVTHSDVTYTVCGVAAEAFYDTRTDAAVTSVSLPATVSYIGDRAFYQCKNMTTVNIPSAVTSIGSQAFFDCRKLMISEDGVLNIPNAVTTIGSYAFQACHALKNVTIGTGVTAIGEGAFMGCTGLETINYNAANCTVIGYQYGNQCWSGCTHACALVIGDNVNNLPAKAFTGFQGLNSIDFGSHVSFSIPDEAFGGTGLTELVIPDFVTSIGKSAFAGCSSLITLTIGTGVTTFGNWAFYNCNHLATVNYNATNCTSAGDQSWPTFDNCGNGTNCTLTIGNNVTHLPQRIFYRFSGLTSLSIGTGLGSISDYAFEYCSSLTSINIPNNVTSIGSSAFAHCTSVTTLDLGTGVQTIGTNAFDGCEGLTSLTIPASVTGIEAASWGADNGAFKNCTGLAEIWFMGATVPSLTNNGVFGGVPNDIPVYVPKGYPTTGSWSYFTNYVSYLRFVGGTDNNNNWNNASNWVGACTGEDTYVHSVPATDEIAIIDGSNDPFIIENSTVKPSKIILGNGRKIKIDGGSQLVYNEPVQVTAIKYINGAEDWNTSSDGWYFIASPINSILNPTDVQGMITADDATVGHTFDLYKYVGNAVTYEGDPIPWQNYRVHSTDFHIENGAGYLYANSSDATLEFSGVTKAYTTSDNYVTLQYDGWNLIGNPYTFEVSADRDFVTLNNQAAVENQQYQHYVIKPCEGIAVYGSHGDKVYFSGDLPSSQSQNNSLNMVLTKANMRDAKRLDNAIVSFNEGEGMPKFNLMEQDAKLYIPQNGMDYAIVYSEEQGVMPLNFEANEIGEYTITVNTENANMSYLHLIDNLIGADIDLLVEPSYTFEAKVSDYASRFRLVFISNTVLEDENGDDSFAFFSNGQLVIANQGRATLQVVDLTGRILSSETIDGSVSKTINATPGIYMLRLVNGDDVKVQKIVVR